MRRTQRNIGSAVLSAAAVLLMVAATPAQEGLGAMERVEEQRLSVDRERREIRIPAEALRVDMPLEFICVVTGTADHEALVRTRVRPSQIHAALLGLGMEPGRPVRFSEAAGRVVPPVGPPVRVEVEWERQDGRVAREPVGRLVRNVATGEPMPTRPFVFVGSAMFEDRQGNAVYAADATGQVVSLVNFESPVIDVGEVRSNANETLEWETDPDAAPPHGWPVTLILTPVGDGRFDADAAEAQAADPAEPYVVVVRVAGDGSLDVNGRAVTRDTLAEAVREKLDEVNADAAPEAKTRVRVAAADGSDADAIAGLLRDAGVEGVEVVPVAGDDVASRIAALRADWERAVLPRADALREAAQVHYDLMNAYQDEINQLLADADRLRREMDVLQRRFEDLTTPQPAPPPVPAD